MHSAKNVALVLAFACSVVSVACGDDRPPPAGNGGNDAAVATTVCASGGLEVVCAGDIAYLCREDGTLRSTEDCRLGGQVCAPNVGCKDCVPGRVRCDGETVERCDDTGTEWNAEETCDPEQEEHCGPNGCSNLCAVARAERSYVGCEYWAVPTLNSQLPNDFQYAVAIANPQLVPAEVRMERAGELVASRTVAPGALEVVALPWIPALKGEVRSERTALVRHGAYRVTSNVPVTVYQFNPLEYRLSRDCEEEEGLERDGECFSYSNDASLLLPTHVLTGNYIALSRATLVLELRGQQAAAMSKSPGFITITGTSEERTLVEVRSSAHTTSSANSLIGPLEPGDTRTFSLRQGETLQLVAGGPEDCTDIGESDQRGNTEVVYCAVGDEYDLTGTEIRADHPVAVIGGHNCSFIPFNRWACDHLEEALFPVEAWGKDVIFSVTQPLRGEPNVIRVVSAHDANTVTFEPAVRDPLLLDQGEFIELETEDDVRVTGTEALAVVQYLTGQDYAGFGTSGIRSVGDPSMSLGIPREQFRNEYTFLAPPTYSQSYVNITAPMRALVILDGKLVTGFEPLTGTTFGTKRIQIEGGVHNIFAGSAFGIVVYGFGQYTSYMYPGGLDLRIISPPI